jgi:hypothetical protein
MTSMQYNSSSARGICSSGSSETEEEDEACVWALRARQAHVPSTREPKVDRATDDRCAWSRTGWIGHQEAKLRENSWHTYYHMNVPVFHKLHDMLFTESAADKAQSRVKGANSTPMGCIETEVKLASTIRILFGEKSKSMVDVFKISPTSCRAAFFDVIDRINNCSLLDGLICSTDHSLPVLEQRALGFEGRSAFPSVFRHCVGAIDGLFIKTEQPTASEVGDVRSYWSGHKKGFGINMQGVCNAQCRIIGFACNTPGSTNDYVAYRHGFFYGHWPTLPQPYYYLGDCAYPLSTHCITPFSGTTLEKEEDAFNFYHSQLRITIERTFGIFVNVFSLFHSPLKYSIANCCKIVHACVRLHNYRIDSGCQHIARKVSVGAVYREAHGCQDAFARSTDVFDVLDDPRYVTDRPFNRDGAYAAYVSSWERSDQPVVPAVEGAGKRDVLVRALHASGAARPAANARA